MNNIVNDKARKEKFILGQAAQKGGKPSSKVSVLKAGSYKIKSLHYGQWLLEDEICGPEFHFDEMAIGNDAWEAEDEFRGIWSDRNELPHVFIGEERFITDVIWHNRDKEVWLSFEDAYEEREFRLGNYDTMAFWRKEEGLWVFMGIFSSGPLRAGKNVFPDGKGNEVMKGWKRIYTKYNVMSGSVQGTIEGHLRRQDGMVYPLYDI